MRRLSKMEAQTLIAWRDCDVGYGFGFKVAAKRCPTPPQSIRRAVRALARKGALEYSRVLFFEDEGLMGAGYILTEDGAAIIREMEERDAAAA